MCNVAGIFFQEAYPNNVNYMCSIPVHVVKLLVAVSAYEVHKC